MARKSINEQLREAIENCGKSRYRISIESGVSEAALSRFVAGKSELTIANAEKLSAAIGIELIVKISKQK